jgi:hypothetical protein
MPRSQNHEYLCIFHSDRERHLLDQKPLSAELAVADHIAPKLFHSPIRSASLLLQTLSGVGKGVTIALGWKEREAEIRRIHSSRNKPPSPAP